MRDASPLLLLTCLALVVAAQPAARAQAADPDPQSCPQKTDYPEPYLDRMTGPGGRWGVGYLMETKEAPVMVVGVTGFGGRRRESGLGGLSVTCAEVRNKTARAVTEVRLSWALFDGATQAVVLRGDLPPAAARLAPGERLALDFDDILFSEISRPLVRDGTLEGSYRWVFRVSAFVYEDGTRWEEEPASLKK